MMRLIIGPKPGENVGDAITMDIRPGAAMVCADMRALPLASQSCAEVVCLHVLEHIERDEANRALCEIRRVLRGDGRVILAVPDMLACARSLLAGNTEVLLNVYSPHPDRAQQHRWGYTAQTLRLAVGGAGYSQWRPLPLTEPHELRIEARP